MKSSHHTILVYESSSQSREAIGKALSGESKIVFQADPRSFLRELKRRHYDIIFIDINPDSNSTFELLKKTNHQAVGTPIIITSKSERAELVVAAIKLGAYDYIAKPFSAARVQLAVARALKQRELQYEVEYLRGKQSTIYDLNKLVGESPRFKEIIISLKKFAQTDSTILISGKTGTGKSFISGSIHYNSPRRNKPFIKINCANLPASLLESELFGHEKGAFTGADKQRIGRFEQANGGTIFLDEIGEINLEIQTKLLRVLEEKSFERIGGNRTINVDVRVIAATNKNLTKQISLGLFREDLYYRINVLPIQLPALKDRQECLAPLSQVLLNKACSSLKKKIEGFAPATMAVIRKYDWPGNIRQLANTIERAVILEDSSLIQPEAIAIPDHRQTIPDKPQERFEPLETHEKELIIEALQEHHWVQKNAAAKLGISPRVLNYKITKFKITHPNWRKNK